MNLTKRISYRERIFVRAVTISTKIEGEKVTKEVLKNALIQENDNDENFITIDKTDAAKRTK